MRTNTIRTGPRLRILVAFLTERRPQRADEAAALLGWATSDVRRHARSADALLRNGEIAWRDVAGWLLDVWPLATLLRVLGDAHAHLLPIGLELIPIVLRQPAYVVHALRAQWQLEAMPHRVARPSTFDEYLTDLLHRAIDPTTIDALRHDHEFVRAYEFPEG